jgi:hypothetical protein
MSTALQLRRGTTEQHAEFTGLIGEVTVDTSKSTIVVHDGETKGGFPLAKDVSIDGAVRSDITQALSDSAKETARRNIEAMRAPSGTGLVAKTQAGTGSTVVLKAGTGIEIEHASGTTGDPVIKNTGVTSVNGEAGDVKVPQYSKAILLTEDGPGSGIDADLLDGQHATYFTPLNSAIGTTIADAWQISTKYTAVGLGGTYTGTLTAGAAYSGSDVRYLGSATAGTWLCVFVQPTVTQGGSTSGIQTQVTYTKCYGTFKRIA